MWRTANPDLLVGPPSDNELKSAVLRRTPGALDMFCHPDQLLTGSFSRSADGLLEWEHMDWDGGVWQGDEEHLPGWKVYVSRFPVNLE